MLKRILKLGAVLALCVAVLAAWLWSEHVAALRRPLAIGPEPVYYVVEPGMTLQQVAADLARRGVLRRPRDFVLHARWRGEAGSIQAGEYELRPGTTPAELLEQLVAGRVVQRALTLVEGWTFREVTAAVHASDYLVHTLDPQLAPGAVMARLGHPGELPEGRFYPDTYHFPRGTTDVAFLQRAYRTMQRRLSQEWAQRAPGLPLDSPYEALILASIVEKETAVPAERARIAGVFVRRLERGMRLETDPTVIYGLGDAFDGNLRRADLRADTPYNTYLHKGLPPTPIAMPGGESLHAALHPAGDEALYFVARGDGSHEFSRTYQEHRRAVRRFQLGGGGQ